MRFITAYFFLLTSSAGIAQKVPINRLISFIGKDERVVITYLQSAQWKYIGENENFKYDTLFEHIIWQIESGQNSFIQMEYYVNKSSHQVPAIELDIGLSDYYGLLKTLPRIGFAASDVERKGNRLTNKFVKGMTHLDLETFANNGAVNGAAYTLYCYH
jgi:hypothetical protein